MLKQLQKVVIGIGILAYAFLGFSPFASATHAMMDMGAADSAMSAYPAAGIHAAEAAHVVSKQAGAHTGYTHTTHAATEEAVAHAGYAHTTHTATSSADCADTCIDSTAAASIDCLEHCLAQAAETDAPLAAIVLISFVVAAAVTTTVQLFSFVVVRIRKDRYIWRFRPLYIFNTVRLLE